LALEFDVNPASVIKEVADYVACGRAEVVEHARGRSATMDGRRRSESQLHPPMINP
jgi:hypothetical protein